MFLVEFLIYAGIYKSGAATVVLVLLIIIWGNPEPDAGNTKGAI